MTPAEICPANAETWAAFEKLAASLSVVHYGPGRGIWDGTRFVVTYAPGRRTYGVNDLKLWPNVAGKRYPALHCSSWTNLFLAWLLRRNELYTHAGNIPDLSELVAGTPDIHPAPGAGPWRGYGGSCTAIAPDGSGVKRSGVPKTMDARELLARTRAGTLPTFMVASQSTKNNGKWLWWHHTVVWAVRDGRLYRIAADGYKGVKGYSAQPMRYVEITDANVGQYASAVYRVWGVDTADGSYGDASKAIAAVEFEAF